MRQMLEIFDDLEQGTEAWLDCRKGIPTASSFKAILARGEGKTRKAYMNRLAAEIVTGEPLENFSNQSMARGHALEGEARQLYAFMHDVEPQQVGFIRNGRKGCSPDSLIADRSMLEIKTQRGDLLIETLFKGEFPPEHKAQVQGQLLVAERELCDLMIYWPGMPPFIAPARRDEPYIKRLSDEVDRFNDELEALVERIRSYGGHDAIGEEAA
jgi:hypothetical protein